MVREGTIVYSRGYGMANLEYGVANAPSTIFHAASLSKQFTALCIHILAQEGKLSLDDPLRKHVPEMNVEGPPITIRHLLHHTSGLRDQWDLLTLAGLRLDDGITDNDILGLLWQQKQLNFQPGDEDLYSNSGYSLLGLIVRRVSGQSLAAFAQERIFGPLGMKNTHFHESYGALVKGRAYSYQRNRDGSYRYVALSYSNTGATSLFTTVEDLALWNGNFDEPRAGGPAAMAALLVSGKWNNGREIGYASGVGVQPYRGVPAVAHSGGDAGYRSYFLRLPQQKLAVIVLGNACDFIAGDVASRVADLYLEGMPGVQPQKTWPREVELQDRDLAPYAGDYEVRPGSVLSFVADKGKLYSQSGGGAAAGLRRIGRQRVLYEGARHHPDLSGNDGQRAGPDRAVEAGQPRLPAQAHRARNAQRRRAAGLRGRLLQRGAAHALYAGDAPGQAGGALPARRAGAAADQP